MLRKLSGPLVLILVLCGAACSLPHLETEPPSAGGTVHSPFRTAPRPIAAGVTFASGGEVGYIPCDLKDAYGLTAGGLDGAGATIAIVDVNDQPNIASDLHGFDASFGLPDPPSFVKYTPFGRPPVDQGWGTEITLDVEWAHAAAPGASIALVEVPTGQISNPRSGNDLIAGVDFAVRSLDADVVSMSWTMPESVMASVFGAGNLEAVDARSFPATNGVGRPVVYLAAAGDAGAQTNWPAIASTVIGVGGTSLAPGAYGYAGFPGTHYDCGGASSSAGVSGSNETVWGAEYCSSGPPPSCSGTGGGASGYLSRPSWQSGFVGGGYRASPDVAMLADPSSGVATFQNGGWNQFLVGGTSLASPLWAGVVASLDEERRLRSLPNLGLTTASAWMYAAAGGDYNDIASGSSPPSLGAACVSNGSCRANAGYDLVTGRGTPKFSRLVADAGVAGTGPGSTRLGYSPLSPVRVMDTRTGLGGRKGSMGNGQTFTLQVTGQHGVPAGAGAIAVNVGVTNTASAPLGYVLLYPGGQPRPLASTVNFRANQTIAAYTQVQLGAGGSLSVYMNTTAGSADVFLDLQGYFTGSSGGRGLYRPLGTPVRAMDTRSGLGTAAAPLGPGEARQLRVAGSPAIASSPAIPPAASSVVLNLTAVSGSASSFLAAYPVPAGGACPTNPPTSNLNFPGGAVQANRVTVLVGAGGAICLFNAVGSVDVLVDLAGWYSSGQGGDDSGAYYTPFQPTRIFDSRLSTPVGPGPQSCPSGGDRNLVIPPAMTDAVALNVVALDAAAPSFLQVRPAGTAVGTSDINFVPGQAMVNTVISGLGSGSTVTLCNANSVANVIVDLNGGYSN